MIERLNQISGDKAKQLGVKRAFVLGDKPDNSIIKISVIQREEIAS